jgi:nitrate/nitrite-specific signal transduction histidine kinase
MSDAPGHAVVFDLIEESRRFVQKLIDENERLGQRLATLERNSPADLNALRDRARELEAENEKLANLYVASYRLSGTEGLIPTLEVVREVVVNLVGSEDFALLLRQHDSSEHRVVLANGALAKRSPNDILTDPRAVEALRLGVMQVAAGVPDPSAATAVVPLTVGGRQVGMLVVGNLLPQKPQLAPLDLEIFELLAQQVGGRLLSGIAQRRSASVPAFDLKDFEGVTLSSLPTH